MGGEILNNFDWLCSGFTIYFDGLKILNLNSETELQCSIGQQIAF
jgi:hypothetical protein